MRRCVERQRSRLQSFEATTPSVPPTITVTSGKASQTDTVYTHTNVDSVVITSGTDYSNLANCISQNKNMLPDIFTAIRLQRNGRSSEWQPLSQGHGNECSGGRSVYLDGVAIGSSYTRHGRRVLEYMRYGRSRRV